MKTQYNYRASGFLLFLSVLTMTTLLAGTVLSAKMVNFGFFEQPGSTVVYPIAFLLSGIVAEVYGYNTSKQLIWIVIICGYIFAFFIESVLLLPSPADWQNEDAYQKIFDYLLRFSTAGTLGIIVGLFVNSYVIAKTKVLIGGRHFWARALGAVALGEAGHIIVMCTLLFWDRMIFEKILIIMASMYLFRMFCVFIFIMPTQIIVNFLKNKEQIDYFDYDLQFNPFKIDK